MKISRLVVTVDPHITEDSRILNIMVPGSLALEAR